MPKMNGFDFLERMQIDLMPPHLTTPVIIISGLSNKTAFEKAEELGINLFLLKPIIIEHLEIRINGLSGTDT